jgi:hypothetical protein
MKLLNALPLNINICRNDTKSSKPAFLEYIIAHFIYREREFTSIYKKVHDFWFCHNVHVFIRKVEISSCGKSLTLCQKEVGDVSCVIWDAALVLAKYLKAWCNDMQEWLWGRSVIELGTGMGCVGLTAACFGQEILVSIALFLLLYNPHY